MLLQQLSLGRKSAHGDQSEYVYLNRFNSWSCLQPRDLLPGTALLVGLPSDR